MGILGALPLCIFLPALFGVVSGFLQLLVCLPGGLIELYHGAMRFPSELSGGSVGVLMALLRRFV